MATISHGILHLMLKQELIKNKLLMSIPQKVR